MLKLKFNGYTFLTIIKAITSIFRKVCRMYNLYLKIRNSLSFPIIIFSSFIKILAFENFQVLRNLSRHMTPFYDNNNLQFFSLEKNTDNIVQ